MYSYEKVTVTETNYPNKRTKHTNNSKKEEPMPRNDVFDTDSTATDEAVDFTEENAPTEEEIPTPVVDARELQEAIADNKRLMAEYSNYRNRVEREKVTAGHNATFKVIQAVLPVLDDIELSLEHDIENIPEPVQRIFSKLIGALESVGLDVVNESGVEFDPTIHEGVLYQEVEGVEPEHIAKVLRTGYRMTADNRVIRGAQVIIAK